MCINSQEGLARYYGACRISIPKDVMSSGICFVSRAHIYGSILDCLLIVGTRIDRFRVRRGHQSNSPILQDANSDARPNAGCAVKIPIYYLKEISKAFKFYFLF